MNQVTSKQRFRLGEYYGKPAQRYHATFNYIVHKTSNGRKVPMILLTDLYLVDQNGKKIRLANDNDFIDKKGRHIVADHTWVKFTKPWYNLPCELVKGDEIEFDAKVEQYKIVRMDFLKQRDQIWQDAKKKADVIYKRWSKYTDTHRRKNFQLSLDKMKAKQKDILDQAKKDQAKLQLVDYGLNYIKHIKLVKKVTPKKGFERDTYNYQQYRNLGYNYTKYLAAHSMNYAGRQKNEE